MKKYLLLNASLFFLTSILFWNCNSINRGKNQKPNIILFLIDDLGWKDVGYMGSTYYETPNIDALAKTGMIFTNAYSNAPNCAPSRASLLTGKYTPRHNIYTVGSSERGHSKDRKLIPIKNNTILSPDHITIADILKNNDYVNISLGKWHLGSPPNYGPLAQGFHYNIAGNHSGHPKSYFSPYNNDNLSDGPEGEYLPERLTNEAIKFIDNNRDNPFFLYLPYYSVHTPIQAKKDVIEKYNKKNQEGDQNNPTYAAMVEATDNSIGKILEHIKKLKLEKNTIVIFLSDNGGLGQVTSMLPLRGSKGMLYEGGIRVPLIIQWKDHIIENSICDTSVIGSDLFPTLLSLLQIDIPNQSIIDGKDLSPLLFNNNKFEREAIYWHFPAYLEGQAEGARDSLFRTRPGGAIRMGDWKLIEYFEDSHIELYNLKYDIGEKNNLVKSNPWKKDELYNKLKEWRNSINAPIPRKLNPNYHKSN